MTKWNHNLQVNLNFCYWSHFSLCVLFRMAFSTAHIMGLTGPSSWVLNYVRLLAGEGFNRHANIDTKLRILSQNMEQACMCPVSTVARESLSKRSVCACPAFLHVSSLASRVTPSINFAYSGHFSANMKVELYLALQFVTPSKLSCLKKASIFKKGVLNLSWNFRVHVRRNICTFS